MQADTLSATIANHSLDPEEKRQPQIGAEPSGETDHPFRLKLANTQRREIKVVPCVNSGKGGVSAAPTCRLTFSFPSSCR